jgi:hypothetical protein
MYQYNDRLKQLFTKYKYIYIYINLALATMFRPLSGSSSGLYNVLRRFSTCLGFHAKRDSVWFTILFIACKSGNEKRMADKYVVTIVYYICPVCLL